MSALQWIRIRDLWKLPDGRDWLWGKLSLVLRGRAMLSKSLIYFSVDGWGYVQCKSRVFVLWLFEFWNAKVGSQEIPGVTGKFGPWSTKWSRAKANRVLPRKCTGHSKHPLSNNTRDDSIHGHHQMVNTKIRLIIFFAAKDREALYRQQKQDLELIVVQIMTCLLQNSGLNWRK